MYLPVLEKSFKGQNRLLRKLINSRIDIQKADRLVKYFLKSDKSK